VLICNNLIAYIPEHEIGVIVQQAGPRRHSGRATGALGAECPASHGGGGECERALGVVLPGAAGQGRLKALGCTHRG